MTTKEILNIYKTQKKRIVQKTLNCIIDAMPLHGMNCSFYIDENGDVDYETYLGRIVLNETHFFTIYNSDRLEPSDYDYKSFDEMVDDDFIEIYYRDVIEEDIDYLILSLEY